MGDFMAALVGYPTAIYTVLLGVVLFYWVLALVGVVDFDSSAVDLDLQAHAEGEVGDLGTLAGFVVAFGLNGVPFSIAFGGLVLLAWTVCCLASMWLLPLVPTGVLQWVAGTALLPVSFLVALPLTSAALRPLRGLFVSHAAARNRSLVGQRCKVVTVRVTETFGQAEVPQPRGAPLNIDVGAAVPNSMGSGSQALIVGYDPATQRYQITAEA